MAQAIGYMLNQWDALCIYTTQGFLNIDNNAAERALRRVGIGRKTGSSPAATRPPSGTATLYSLIASAERHGIDPQRYLTGVLARIASLPVSQLEKLLPEQEGGRARMKIPSSPFIQPTSDRSHAATGLKWSAAFSIPAIYVRWTRRKKP